RDTLNATEVAMHRAKRIGPDQFEVYDANMADEAHDRARLSAELAAAISSGQLTVSYQPIVYLPTENLAGFEALVRWNHPTRGQLGPSEFVPLAEESDLISQLGAFVLRTAANEASRWQKQLPRDDNPLFVSVNISSADLLNAKLVQEVGRIIAEVGLPKDCLRLELTETLVMSNPVHAANMLGELRTAGARIAIDDFGTGYSSLAYLQRFDFDVIKIDRELVQVSSEDVGGAAIVRSIVALAHELGKKIVAEGVETPEDFTFLRSLGCEFGQGFYYGEAMAPREVADLLKVVRKAERRFQRRMFRAKPPAQVAQVARPAIEDAGTKAAARDAAKRPPAERDRRVAAARGTASPDGAAVPSRANGTAQSHQSEAPSHPAPNGSAVSGNGAKRPPPINGAGNGAAIGTADASQGASRAPRPDANGHAPPVAPREQRHPPQATQPHQIDAAPIAMMPPTAPPLPSWFKTASDADDHAAGHTTDAGAGAPDAFHTPPDAGPTDSAVAPDALIARLQSVGAVDEHDSTPPDAPPNNVPAAPPPLPQQTEAQMAEETVQQDTTAGPQDSEFEMAPAMPPEIPATDQPHAEAEPENGFDVAALSAAVPGDAEPPADETAPNATAVAADATVLSNGFDDGHSADLEAPAFDHHEDQSHRPQHPTLPEPDAFQTDQLSTLPPGIARSLAKLAGVLFEENEDDGSEGGGHSANGHSPFDADNITAPPPFPAGARQTGTDQADVDALLNRFRSVDKVD
ncbi:MAG: EAL domain-containing protein, partial [Pseudomonadota bacterium]